MRAAKNAGLVVVAAGAGVRFGGPKQFRPLGGKPLLSHCLARFDAAFDLACRVVVLPERALHSADWERVRSGLRRPVRAVAGGATRAASVRAGVEALAEECELVIVHDGARPFVPVEACEQCLARLEADPALSAAIVGVAVTDTLKELGEDGTGIVRTIDRRRAARAETPQVCRRAALVRALAQEDAPDFTDDAQAIESLGMRTAVVLHTGFNIKVTTPGDLHAAEAWLRGG